MVVVVPVLLKVLPRRYVYVYGEVSVGDGKKIFVKHPIATVGEVIAFSR